MLANTKKTQIVKSPGAFRLKSKCDFPVRCHFFPSTVVQRAYSTHFHPLSIEAQNRQELSVSINSVNRSFFAENLEILHNIQNSNHKAKRI